MRILSVAAILMVSGAAAAAQTTLPVQPAVPAKFAGVYRMATAELVPPGTPGSTRSGPNVLFNNMLYTPYFATPTPGQEWVDEGALLNRNACATDQINGFDLAYCSAAADPTGNSGTITIRFYDQNVVCGGPPAWPSANCAYQLTGLPLGTPSGSTQCWNVHIDLGGGFECPATLAGSFHTEPSASSFGWSILVQQPITGPSCRTGGYQTYDSFTAYDRANGRPLGCHSFGGNPRASFGMKLYGPMANGIRYRSEAPAYPRPLDTLELVAASPIAQGRPADWEVSPVLSGHNYWLMVSTRPQDRAVLNGQGTLLLSAGDTLGLSPLSMPNGMGFFSVPGSPPGRIYVQAVETVGAFTQANVTALSNGLVHCF